MDYGHEQTDKELKKLENRISKEYQRAAVDVKKKSKEYMEKFKAKDKIKREQLKNGEITKSDYNQWKTGQIMIGKRWEEMRDTLYQDLSNAKEIAKSMTTEFSYDVYALNHNYGTFEVESGSLMNTSYTLYDRDTVYTMIKDKPTLLPNFKESQKDIKKDKRWSLTKMNSAVLQGILQGESMDGIAKRLSDVVGMDEKIAIRNARTMTTAAENLGRQHSYERAQKMGISLEKQWMATLDSRTRDSHRMLDGETVKINETFSNKLECPGDPSGDPSEVYNCRCTMVAVIANIQHEELRDENGNILTKDSALGDISYEEWKHGHEGKEVKEVKEKSEEQKQPLFKPRIMSYINNCTENAYKYYDDVKDTVDGDLLSIYLSENNFNMEGAEEGKKELLEQANLALRQIVEESDFTMRIKASNLEKVLDDGYFKNQFETGTSGGAFSPATRKNLEKNMFGVPKNDSVLDADRPVYGMFCPKLDSASTDELNKKIREYYVSGPGSWYGDGITVVLEKSNVFNQATMTIGDSLDYEWTLVGTEVSNPQYAGSHDGSPLLEELVKLGRSNPTADKVVDKMMSLAKDGDEYFEFQLHGKESHSADNIREVYIDNRLWQSGHAGSLIDKLDLFGIPWKIIGD